MTGAFDKLEAGIWQVLRNPAGGADGNQHILRVGEQEHRRQAPIMWLSPASPAIASATLALAPRAAA